MIKRFSTPERVALFSGFISICLFSWLMQATLLLGWDVSWGLHEARRLLAGGSYFKDFYEMTPPMFLYLYIPVILLNKFFSVTLDIALRSYFFVLAIGSFFFCYHLTKKIFIEDDKNSAIIFLLTLASAFFLLPLFIDFGQREHMLIILSMPYLLLMSLRLEKQPISVYYSLSIGLISGIGFIIKPFFLISYGLIELYYLYQTKKWLAWYRTETIAIIALIIFYIISTYIFYPDYFKIILPLATRIYYQGINNSLVQLIYLPVFLYSIFIAVIYAFIRSSIPYQKLTTCFFIALIGFLGSYFLQHTNWYYHILPAYSMTIILAGLMYSLFIKYGDRTKQRRWLLCGICLAGMELYAYADPSIFTLLIFTPVKFFGFFAFIFALFFSLSEKNIFLIFSKTTAIIVMSAYVAYLTHYDLFWQMYRIPVTFFCLIGLFYLSISNRTMQKQHLFVCALLGILIAAYPLHFAMKNYRLALGYKNTLTPIIIFLQTHAKNKPIYFFSTEMHHEFPAVDYAEAIPASRYPMLPWVSGYLRQMNQPISSTKRERLHQDKKFFMQTVVEELNHNKPVYVFVDILKNKYYLSHIQYEYLDDFLKDTNFQNAWKDYRYLTTIDGGLAYQFAVYQRRNHA